MNGFRILDIVQPKPDACTITLAATWSQRNIAPTFALVCAGLTWAGYNQFMRTYGMGANVPNQSVISHVVHLLLPVLMAAAAFGLAILTLFFAYAAITGFNRIRLDVTPEMLRQSSRPLPQWISPRKVNLQQARATVMRIKRRTNAAHLGYAYHLVIIQPDEKVITLGKWIGSDDVPVRVAQAINQVIEPATT